MRAVFKKPKEKLPLKASFWRRQWSREAGSRVLHLASPKVVGISRPLCGSGDLPTEVVDDEDFQGLDPCLDCIRAARDALRLEARTLEAASRELERLLFAVLLKTSAGRDSQ